MSCGSAIYSISSKLLGRVRYHVDDCYSVMYPNMRQVFIDGFSTNFYLCSFCDEDPSTGENDPRGYQCNNPNKPLVKTCFRNEFSYYCRKLTCSELFDNQLKKTWCSTLSA